MCDKVANTYPSTIEYVPDRFKTQEMCDKAVDKCHFVFDSVPDQFKTLKMCNKIVSDDPFKSKYCHKTLHIQSECGKMRTRITPNTDTFYAVKAVTGFYQY